MKNILQPFTGILIFCCAFPFGGTAQDFQLSKTGGATVVAVFQENEEGEWIHWDSGENQGNSIGANDVAQFSIAHRWEPADIDPYDEMHITMVRFFPRYQDAVYTVKIWTGADAAEVYSQVVDTFTIEAWNEIELVTPFEIDASVDLWYGVDIDTQGGYPAGCDAGPEVAGKGNMTLWEGDWVELTHLNPDLPFNWNLGAFVVNGDNGNGEPEDTYEVTFNLDMTYVAQYFNPDLDVVYVTGHMTEWAEPGELPELQTMTRIEDSYIFTRTLQLEEGEYEYKYFLNDGWYGGEWQGYPNREITVAEDITINDLWGAGPQYGYGLTLLTDPEDAGTVDGEASFLANAMVQVSATPEEGFSFLNWTDEDEEVVSTDAQYQFNMPPEGLTLTANFEGTNLVDDPKQHAIKIFPNPVQDHFNIRSDYLITHIKITDLSGRVIYSQPVNDNQIRIEKSWEAGMYLVSITTAKGVFVRKVQVGQ